MITRRTLGTLAVLAAATTLAGCAAMRSVSSEVTSFGEWPADRKAGTYAFERLPSQQNLPATSDALEAAASGALKKAGFEPAAAGKDPDVLVQLAARSGRADLSPWSDPIWWRGSFGVYRHGPWFGPRWGMGLQMDTLRYEREVAVLIRDRASGKPLFEARASNEGNTSTAGSGTLAAMFQAALMDFPRLGINPRQVVVTLPD
jgi:predicted small secreted protein